MSQPNELPAFTTAAADLQHFLYAKEARQAKKADLYAFFNATAELRCSPLIFEKDEPGAREALIAWARARALKIEEVAIDSDLDAANMVTRAETHHHHHIDVRKQKRAA